MSIFFWTKKANEDGASYLEVGAIYKSTTKKDASVVVVDKLRKIDLVILIKKY